MPTLFPARNRSGFDLSNTLFTASMLCMAITEAFIIRGLWYSSVYQLPRHRGFDLPFLVWIPCCAAFLFLQVVRRYTRDGHITPRIATTLSFGITLLLLLAYLLITRFAQIAFH
jgi:hypothetical protein